MNWISRSLIFYCRLNLWFYFFYSYRISWNSCFNWNNFSLSLLNPFNKKSIFFLSPFRIWSLSLILTFCRRSLTISLYIYLLIWKLKIIFLIVIAFSLIILTIFLTLLSISLSKKTLNWREKLIPFECGYDFFSYSRIPFSIRFFLIAIIFIIFDVEIALILPIIPTILIRNIFKWTLTSFLFICILILGVLFEWKEESFEWKLFS